MNSFLNNLNNKNTAIVVIEFQKSWTRKGNFLNLLIRRPLKKNEIVKRTLNFLDKAREKGYTVIHAPLILDKQKKDEYKKMPFMPKLLGVFTKGTWKAEFEEGIKKTSDIVATGRTGFDACQDSNLVNLLYDRSFQNVLLAGFITDQCVEATLKTLEKRGLNCIIIKDGTATTFAFIQRKVEKRNQSVDSNTLINFM